MGEHKEDVPWTFLCPDAADQELDHTSAWQIAQRKLEMMQEQALAIEKEEQLAQSLSLDKSGRKHLLNTCKEFQGAVHKLTSHSFLQNLERAQLYKLSYNVHCTQCGLSGEIGRSWNLRRPEYLCYKGPHVARVTEERL